MPNIARPFTCLVLAAVVFVPQAWAQTSSGSETKHKTGSIRGVVVDVETREPISGVTVWVIGAERGMASGERGDFEIDGLPVGSYTVQFRSVGYTPVTMTDIIVRAGRKTVVEPELRETVTEIKGVVVAGEYFSESPTAPASSTQFSSEEIRRSPGSAGDVSRIMFSLPSVAKVNDQVNNLIVRGGSPTENSFYLENIEIPNINHYPLFGTSGGPISLINIDFVRDVTFSAGGFSAAYGDRLSSVMELTFREGDREKIDLQGDMNFAGIGLIGEGPIAHAGSWMISARRSYLDLLTDAIGSGVAPRYSDYQGKVLLDLSPRNRLTLLGVLGVDYISFKRQDAIDDGMVTYGWSDGYEYTAGANWRFLWGNHGYSNTSLSLLGTRMREDFLETSTEVELVRQNNFDGAAQFRNVNFYRINERHQLEFGCDLKNVMDDFDYVMADYTDYFGDTISGRTVYYDIDALKFGGFVSYIVGLSKRLEATVGARYDYFKYTGNSDVSPRASLVYTLSDRTRLNAACGIYNQTVPMVLLSQQASNKSLKNPRAYHYILGIDHLLREDTRCRIEGYYKWYRNFPLSVDEPELFIIDEMIYSSYFLYHPHLRDDGQARSYGVEMTVQKKLREGIYGLLGASWFRSQYEDLNGTWRNRTFDNRVVLSAEGGYKPNERWEFSLRWVFAGGAPYTPLDIDASEQINRSVYDQSRVNESRYPSYHSLNLRADRRFNFTNSNLIVYLSIWNAYNRENIASYYWNEIERKPDTILQWTMLPILGLEFEF